MSRFLDKIAAYFRKPGLLDTVIYSCNPLLIVNEEGEVLYANETDVEFTPFDSRMDQGEAIALNPDREGFQPQLRVTGRIDLNITNDPHVRPRGGIQFVGTAIDGSTQTWYIDKAADEFLLHQLG